MTPLYERTSSVQTLGEGEGHLNINQTEELRNASRVPHTVLLAASVFLAGNLTTFKKSEYF